MRIYAVVNEETGCVVNTVVWDGETDWAPPEGHKAIATNVAGIGWIYHDGQFVPPSKGEDDDL
ncbi:hypothetical protein PS619_00118 [Pseudomonas fluorescens]|nr:hypothetical protein PS619_00118 [Pseudomonas fluorescens]